MTVLSLKKRIAFHVLSVCAIADGGARLILNDMTAAQNGTKISASGKAESLGHSGARLSRHGLGQHRTVDGHTKMCASLYRVSALQLFPSPTLGPADPR